MSTNSLAEWLEAIWRDTDGYVYIPTKDEDQKWNKMFALWPKQKDLIVKYLLKESAKGREVYYSPALWKTKSISEDQLKVSWTLWADFDGNAPEEWGQDNVPEPSALLQSSGPLNQHAYWFLEEPITDPKELSNKNRTLAYELDADVSAWNAGRVLRPPETINYGYGKDRSDNYSAKIEKLTDTRFPSERFKTTDKFAPLVKETLKDIPSVEEVLAKGTWHDDFWSLFKSNPEKGVRSDALQKIAYYGAEAGFNAQQIYAVLLSCDERWGKYKSRKDREQRLSSMIDRAIDRYPTALSEFNPIGLTQTEGETELESVYTFEDFISTKINIDWLFEGLLTESGYGIIAGQPGVGKSQLALRACESIAQGKDLLGFWKNKVGPKKVMFFSLEMSFAELTMFFSDMEGSFMQTKKENLLISPIGDTLPLDFEEGQKYLESLLEEFKPEVLVIDSLSMSLSGNVRDDDVVSRYNRYLKKLRKRYNLAVIAVHHNRKVQDKRFIAKELDDLYGSRFLAQDAQFVFMLYQTPKDPRNILHLNPAKMRFMAQPDPLMLEHTEDLDFNYYGAELNDNDRNTGSGLSSLFSK